MIASLAGWKCVTLAQSNLRPMNTLRPIISQTVDISDQY